LLISVQQQVRRDTEKARRLARQQQAAERERIRLESKAFKNAKKDPNGMKAMQLQELAARNRKKQDRLNMDPFEAVITADAEELEEILDDVFSLFDLDCSQTMDFSEFEAAIESLGITGHSDLLHALISAMDTGLGG